jgi:hypothetical protein
LFSGLGSGAFLIQGILLFFDHHQNRELNSLSKNHSFLTTGTTKFTYQLPGIVVE